MEHVLSQLTTCIVGATLNTRICSELSDDIIQLVRIPYNIALFYTRCVFFHEGGGYSRDIQELSSDFTDFECARHRNMLRNVQDALRIPLKNRFSNLLNAITKLDFYKYFSMYGHSHKSASHAPRHEEAMVSVGHLFILNMRTHAFKHLFASGGVHEYHMSARQYVIFHVLRQCRHKWYRVLVIFDKPGFSLTIVYFSARNIPLIYSFALR